MFSSCSGAQNLSGQRSAMRTALIKDLAINNRVFNSFGSNYESPATPGQIVNRLASGAGNLVVIENHNVSRVPGHQAPAILQSEEVRRLRRGALDRLLERQHLALAHPLADQVAG